MLCLSLPGQLGGGVWGGRQGGREGGGADRGVGGCAQLCSIFRVPIAIVSLVDTDRQWFKSIQGLPVSETSRKASFCAWTLLPACPTVLLVPDARLDERRAPLRPHSFLVPFLFRLEL